MVAVLRTLRTLGRIAVLHPAHTETEPGGGGGWWWSFGGFQVNPEKVGLLWREMAICVAENRVGPF